MTETNRKLERPGSLERPLSWNDCKTTRKLERPGSLERPESQLTRTTRTTRMSGMIGFLQYLHQKTNEKKNSVVTFRDFNGSGEIAKTNFCLIDSDNVQKM
jgi:hypothetical protein